MAAPEEKRRSSEKFPAKMLFLGFLVIARRATKKQTGMQASVFGKRADVREEQTKVRGTTKATNRKNNRHMICAKMCDAQQKAHEVRL